MHTVPAGTVRSAAGALSTSKRSVPTAFTAAVRVRPRSWAWLSKNSPRAVWGKLWLSTQSVWMDSAWIWAAAAYSRTARSQSSSGRTPARAAKPSISAS